jgi:hypothetical protein
MCDHRSLPRSMVLGSTKQLYLQYSGLVWRMVYIHKTPAARLKGTRLNQQRHTLLPDVKHRHSARDPTPIGTVWPKLAKTMH